jgi:hypothetical protein
LVRAHQFLNLTYLWPGKSTAPLQPDWIQPELSHLFLALNMDMRRFLPIARVKEKTVGPTLTTVGI